MKIVGIIPARFGSTRFPGKPLTPIHGVPMIVQVYNQVCKAHCFDRVVVATDHDDIKSCVENAGGNVVITMEEHESGTDRCLEAYNKLEEEFDAVVNIQGDEPFIKPEMIEDLAQIIEKPSVSIATLIKKIDRIETLLDPNKVKVVINAKKEALYFSRSPIPFFKGLAASEWLEQHTYYKHIGMYAYKPDVLREITHMEVSSLEKAESLEQLRWMENGLTVHCGITVHESLSVDTPEDLNAVLQQNPQG